MYIYIYTHHWSHIIGILCVYTWYIYISYIEIIMEASKSWAMAIASEGFALLRYEMGSGSRHGSWQPPTWTGDSAAKSPRVGNCRSLGVELTGTTLASCHWLRNISIPIGSMYGIYGNIYHQYTPNVSIYTIHGSYGIYFNDFQRVGPFWKQWVQHERRWWITSMAVAKSRRRSLWGHGGSQFSSVRFLSPCGTIGQ